MYNARRYSLTRYSVNREIKTVEIEERFSGTMGAVAGAAVPVEFRGRFAETLHGSARGTVSLISTFPASSGLFAAVNGSADVITRTAFSETLHAGLYAQKNTPVVLGAQEALAARIWASKDLPSVSLTLAECLIPVTEGSKHVPASLSGAEILTSLLEATSQTTERVSLQLTIPPGGELRVDSELFTVYLNGENALHTQSGDWISISRSLIRLIVESASGGQLQGQLIYTERYL